MLQTLEKLNLHREKPSIYTLIKTMTTPDNMHDGLSFEQFMQLSITYYSDRYTREGIKHIFQLFDEDGLGVISRDSMRKMATQLGIFLNKDDLDLMFEKASSDGKVISYDDFEFFMKKDEIKQ